MPPSGEVHPKSKYILGVDFARMGEDESVFVVLEECFTEPGTYYVVYIDCTKHKLLTDAIERVVRMNQRFNFEAIYLDSTGMGAGACDVLKEYLGSKIHEFNFTIKSKMDIYSNLKLLMEKGKLKVPNDKKLIYQLLDLKYELSGTGNMKIHHSERGHDDYADALALAAIHFKPGNGFVYNPTIA